MTVSETSILNDFNQLVSHLNTSEQQRRDRHYTKKPNRNSSRSIQLWDTLFAHSTDNLSASITHIETWYPILIESFWNLFYLLLNQRRFDDAERFQRLFRELHLSDPDSVSDGVFGVLLLIFSSAKPCLKIQEPRSLLHSIENKDNYSEVSFVNKVSTIDVSDSCSVVGSYLQKHPFSVTFSPSRTFDSCLEQNITSHGKKMRPQSQESWFLPVSESINAQNRADWLPAKNQSSKTPLWMKHHIGPFNQDCDSAYESVDGPIFDIYDWSDILTHDEIKHSLQWDYIDSDRTTRLPLPLTSPFLTEQRDDIFHAVYIDAMALPYEELFCIDEKQFVESLLYALIGQPSRAFSFDKENSCSSFRIPDTLIPSLTLNSTRNATLRICDAGTKFLRLQNIAGTWKSNPRQYKSTGLALSSALTGWLDFVRSCVFRIVQEHRGSTLPFGLLEIDLELNVMIRSIDAVYNVFESKSPQQVINSLYDQLKLRFSQQIISLHDDFESSIGIVFMIMLNEGCQPRFNFLDKALGLSSPTSLEFDGTLLTEMDPFGEFWSLESNMPLESPCFIDDEMTSSLGSCVRMRELLTHFDLTDWCTLSRDAMTSVRNELMASRLQYVEFREMLERVTQERLQLFWEWRRVQKANIESHRKYLQEQKKGRVGVLEDLLKEKLEREEEERLKKVEHEDRVRKAIEEFLIAHREAKSRQIQMEKDEDAAFLRKQEELELFEKELEQKEIAALKAAANDKLESMNQMEARLAWRTKRFHFYMERKHLLQELETEGHWQSIQSQDPQSSGLERHVEEPVVLPLVEKEAPLLDADTSMTSASTSVYESALEDFGNEDDDVTSAASTNLTEIDPTSDGQPPSDVAFVIHQSNLETEGAGHIVETDPTLQSPNQLELKAEEGLTVPVPSSTVIETHPWKPYLSSLGRQLYGDLDQDKPVFGDQMTKILKEQSLDKDYFTDPDQLTRYMRDLWKSQSRFLSRLVCSVLFPDGMMLNPNHETWLSSGDIRYHFKLLTSRLCIADGVFASYLSDHLFRGTNVDDVYNTMSISLNLNGRQKIWPPSLEEISQCLDRISLEHDSCGDRNETKFLEWKLNLKARKVHKPSPRDLSALQIVDLVYSPPPCFSFLLDDASLVVYNRVFHTLLNILRADEAVNRVSLSQLWHVQRGKGNGGRSRNDMRLLIQFLHYARVVVKGILGFVYDVGVHQSTKDFLNKMDDIASRFDPNRTSIERDEGDLPTVEHVIQSHGVLLNQLQTRLFLLPNQRFLYEQLEHVLQVVISLSYEAQGMCSGEVLISSLFDKFKQHVSLFVVSLRNFMEESGDGLFDILLLRVESVGPV